MSTPLDTDKLESLLNDRDLLVTSLENKQVEASDDETITSLVGKVNTIVTGELVSDPYFDPNGSLHVSYQDKAFNHVLSLFDRAPDKIMQYILSRTDIKLYNSGFYGVTAVHLKSAYTYTATSLASLCMYLPQITSFTWDSNLDTSVFTSLKNTFMGCPNLTTMDLSGFDTSGVTTLEGMFSSCPNLVSVNFEGWDTSHVTNFANMFNWCSSLTSLDLSSFTLGDGLTIDFYNMYSNGLTYLDISGFDFVNTTSTLNRVTYLAINLNADCFIYVKDQANLERFSYYRSGHGSFTNIHVKEV